MGYQKMSGSSPKNENKRSSLKAQKRKDEVTFFEESKVDQDKKRKKAKESDTPTEGAKKFELNGHKFFLTYSGLTNEQASKEAMLEFVKELTVCQGLVEWSIGKEEHPNPDDPVKKWHLHVYFCTEKKKKVKNPHKHFMWKEMKGDYQAVGSKKSFAGIPPAEQRKYVVDYTMKDGDFIQQLNAEQAAVTDQDIEERVLNASSKQEGLEMYAAADPKGFMKGFNNINSALTWKFSTKEIPPKFDIFDFRRDIEPLNFNKSPNWVVFGDAQKGKSQWVKACLYAAGYKRPLTVSTISGLKKFNPEFNDSIIFEECNFKDAKIKDDKGVEKVNQNQLDQETTKNLLEFEEPREIADGSRLPCPIPAGIPKVFITNKDGGDIFPGGVNAADKMAISERHMKIEVRGALYPYEKNDKVLRREGNFAELYAREVTRKALRGIRQEAKDGTLKLGPRTELHDAMEKAETIRALNKRKLEEQEVKIVIPTAKDIAKMREDRKKQKVDLFTDWQAEKRAAESTGVTRVL